MMATDRGSTNGSALVGPDGTTTDWRQVSRPSAVGIVGAIRVENGANRQQRGARGFSVNRVMEVLTAALRAGRERLKSLGSAGFVAIAVVGVVVAIFLAEGFKVTTYDLQNPGVWMTRQNAGNSGPGAMVGHFNTQALEIESGIPTAMDGLDVAQDGDRVVVFDAAGMKVLNAATEELADAGQRTPGGSVELAGGRYLIVNGDGKAWTGSADAVGTWDAGRKPDLKASKGAPVAIGSDGTVAALNADESKVTVVDSGGERRQVSFQKIAGDAADLQLALVGTTPVVLDPTAALLYWPDAAPVEVASAGQVPQLQLRGDDPDHAYVAVVGGVTVAPAGGGKPTLVADDAATGTPVRPVRVGGCTYSAWISRGFMSSRCDNGAVATGPLTKFDAANRVKFRVNRSDVALNNLDTAPLRPKRRRDQRVDGKWDVPDQGQPTRSPMTANRSSRCWIWRRSRSRRSPSPTRRAPVATVPRSCRCSTTTVTRTVT